MSFKNRVSYGANTGRQTIPSSDDWWKKILLPAEVLLILAQNYETSLSWGAARGEAWQLQCVCTYTVCRTKKSPAKS